MRRLSFDKQIEQISVKLIEMADLLKSQIEGALESYSKRDSELAESIIEIDKEVNDKEKEIEQLCLKMLLLQQPVAHDLRTISAALKIITDMERIGDQAADIAEITVDLTDTNIAEIDLIISSMGKTVIDMLEDTGEAYKTNNKDTAKKVLDTDDVVDDLFIALKEAVTQVVQGDKGISHDALDYLMVGKHLEKIGDYTVNVARWVMFIIEG